MKFQMDHFKYIVIVGLCRCDRCCCWLSYIVYDQTTGRQRKGQIRYLVLVGRIICIYSEVIETLFNRIYLLSY